MWIEIDKDIFEDSDFKGLNYIYQILSWYPKNSIPRYKIFINPEKVKVTTNYKKLKGIENNLDEIIEAQFNEFVTTKPKNAKRDYKITNKRNPRNFNIEESIRFFSQPVSIILENNKNDSLFIIAIITHYDKKNGVVKEHLKNGWIKFENAGGCSNIENFVNGHLSILHHLSIQNYNRNLSDYFRGLIILDSDKEFENQPSKHSKLLENLKAKGIENVHVLHKRMMENYLPDEVYEDLKSKYRKKNKDLIKWIDVYLNLNNNPKGQKQKDYLNIKSGFPKETDENKDVKPINPEILKLYDIPKKDFDILNKGFYLPDFKNTFPTLFEKNKVNKHTLNQRCNSNELQDIFNKISELL